MMQMMLFKQTLRIGNSLRLSRKKALVYCSVIFRVSDTESTLKNCNVLSTVYL